MLLGLFDSHSKHLLYYFNYKTVYSDIFLITFKKI
jgi:hypothetical protein